MFDYYFEVFLADTPNGKKEHYKLRYQVYCEELGYEEKGSVSGKESEEFEKDEWDDYSIHFLIRHKQTGQWVGAMRLVQPKIENNTLILPLQKVYCKAGMPIELALNIYQDVEISRLCLLKTLRKRKTDKASPFGQLVNQFEEQPAKDFNIDDRRQVTKSLIWGLFRAATVYSQKNDIKNWYFLGARALARSITREGFDMQKIGEGVDHRGMRYPYHVAMETVYHHDFWGRHFKNSYRLYSEIDVDFFQDSSVLPQCFAQSVIKAKDKIR